MNALERHLNESRALITSMQLRAQQQKAAGVDFESLMVPSVTTPSGTLFGDRNVTRNRVRYSQNRGWLYSAVSKLAEEGAGQPVNLARITNATPNPDERSSRLGQKHITDKMTKTMRNKTADQELEIIESHELLDVLEQPNPIQGTWQFVNSFITNLNLTGWGYIIGGMAEDGNLEFYSLPTTWVKPDHSEGPFTRFLIVNPKEPTDKNATILDRENVAFAYLPDPSDPLSALPPSDSQLSAIRIDDHIQTSQERFFRRGMFPSMIVTIGNNPHPDVSGGTVRPRLTGPQRRQIQNVIRANNAGVENYGDVAIVDGMVEKFERLSATQNEMGWEKSEDKIKSRILSAFGVHPFILGEAINIGGYAQASVIEERFCKRVNTFLDMLSNIMTNFAGPMVDQSSRLVVWWEECATKDPQIRWQNLRHARDSGSISKNEYRAELGFPPDENDEGPRAKLLENPAGMAGSVQILAALSRGEMSEDAAALLLSEFLQKPVEWAQQITQATSETQAMLQAVDALNAAVVELKTTPEDIAKQICSEAKLVCS